VVDFGWNQKSPSPQGHPLSPQPLHYDGFNAFLSPNGKRILWVFRRRVGNVGTIYLWISDAEGKSMRPLREYNTHLPVWDRFDLRAFEWTPDSLFVSYLQQDTLYKIPVSNRVKK